MDLFSGLESLGISGFENANLYEEEEKAKNSTSQEEPVAITVNEIDFLFQKRYSCPICGHPFEDKSVRTNKMRLIGTDTDLRPRYQDIDVIKYDVVACPNCGYATLGRYWAPLSPVQTRNVKDKICSKFRPIHDSMETYSYEDALKRYQLSLACALARNAKASEKAYICLKAAWVLRGSQEDLRAKSPDEPDEDILAELKKLEEEETAFLKSALDGFLNARKMELSPICGMDSLTLDYLIAALLVHFRQYEIAQKLVSQLILSCKDNKRLKERTRDLKDMIMDLMKQKQQ